MQAVVGKQAYKAQSVAAFAGVGLCNSASARGVDPLGSSSSGPVQQRKAGSDQNVMTCICLFVQNTR